MTESHSVAGVYAIITGINTIYCQYVIKPRTMGNISNVCVVWECGIIKMPLYVLAM